MATLIDSPEFSANEIYEIQQTDAVEGAAVGAGFGGIGLSNQPHQQLANRTSYIKGRQDTNIANIGLLQAFEALFSGSMGQNGYIAVPFADVSRGQIQMIIQWGFYSFAGLAGGGVENAVFTVTLPSAFSNANEWAGGFYATNNTAGDGALINSALALETVTPLGRNSISFFSDWDGSGTVAVASGTKAGLTGFYWIAVGF
ncbi:MAG TPA: hypothetical protein VKS22_01970 [Candidatus Binataceae bacterium]|nr:hypothetical protein [Candidatus Binataceae bacterium]